MRALSITFIMVSVCLGLSARAEVGVTDTEIKLGGHSILSGQFASYSAINLAAKAYFDKINAQGGVNGRKITYLIEDNAFSPKGTLDAVRKLIQREKVFALFLNLGVTHVSAYKVAQEAKVPDMLVGDSATDYTQPLNHYTFGALPVCPVEGKAIGDLLVRKFKGKKVGFLVPNTQVGYDMMDAVKAAAGTNVTWGPEEMAPWDAADANAQIVNLMNAKVDIIVAFSAPPITPNAMRYAVQKGFKPQWVMNDYNADQETLKVAGPAAEGAIVVNNLYSDWTKPAFVEHFAMMKKAYPNIEPSSYTVMGQVEAELMIEFIKRAGKDLTREGLIKAAETLKDWRSPMVRSPFNLSETNHVALADGIMFSIAKNGKWVEYEKDPPGAGAAPAGAKKPAAKGKKG